MKNQYVGDIGDYGKYSMLRAFAEAGVKVGVNWYLTENDGSNDGKFVDYLKKGELQSMDPQVFDVLKTIVEKKGKSVKDIERSGIIKNAVFYDKILERRVRTADRDRIRSKWFCESMELLSDAELIFMDPDNGLFESNDTSKLGAEKYVMPDEADLYFNAGHDVVYYCHKGRRTQEAWESYKNHMFRRIPKAKPVILTFHKGSQRSYVFLIHEEHFDRYRKIIDGFMSRWNGPFSEEPTGHMDVCGDEKIEDGIIQWCGKYVVLFHAIFEDEDLRSFFKRYSVYRAPQGYLGLHEILRTCLHEAYDSNVVIADYGQVVEDGKLSAQDLAEPAKEWLDSLTDKQILAVIAWHFRRDHFSEGSWISDSVANGHMAVLVDALLERCK